MFLIPVLLASVTAQVTPDGSGPPERWPDAAPGRVLSTPNWSDYNLYPRAARQREEEGSVTAELLIAASGRPERCRINVSSGYGALDEGTCALLMTMRFAPAAGVTGGSAATSFRRTIGWYLTSPRPFVASSVTVAFSRTGNARPICRPVAATGPYAALWTRLACSVVLDTGYVLHAAVPADGDFVLAAQLDAGDPATSHVAWPAGTPIAEETLDFTIGNDGDPTACIARSATGWGPRGLNNLSPCGRLVSALWLADAKGRRGVMRTRIYRAVPASSVPAVPAP